MKIGTILENPWATNGNPTQKSIYIGIKGDYFETICFYNGLHKCQYYKRDLKHFKVLGMSKMFDVMKEELKGVN